MKRIVLTMALSVAATLLLEHGLPVATQLAYARITPAQLSYAQIVYAQSPPAQLTHVVKLEKPRATVTEITAPPGVPREPYIRPTDQVIVFLDDCTYDRVSLKTGARQPVKRKSGDVIWHDKGDRAPQLINTGSKPYRTVVIAIK